MADCRSCGQPAGNGRRKCRECSLEDRYGVPSDYHGHTDSDGVGCWVQDPEGEFHASMYFEGSTHACACGEILECPVADVKRDVRRVASVQTCSDCVDALEGEGETLPDGGGFERADELIADGGVDLTVGEEAMYCLDCDAWLPCDCDGLSTNLERRIYQPNVATDGGQTQLVDDKDPFGIGALAKGDEIAVKYETPRSDYPQTRTGTVMGSGTVEREYGPIGSTEIRLSGGLTLWPAWDEIRSEDAGRLGEIVDVRRVETDGGVDHAYLSDEGPHRCDICEIIFAKTDTLANHICIPRSEPRPKPATTVFRGPADPPEEWTGGGA